MKGRITITPIKILGSDIGAVKIYWRTSHGRVGPSGTYYSTTKLALSEAAKTIGMLKREGCAQVDVTDYRY